MTLTDTARDSGRNHCQDCGGKLQCREGGASLADYDCPTCSPELFGVKGSAARQAAERYIVYTGEEYMYFDTESEAITQAERDIKGWRDLARRDCEWSEEVERVAVFCMIAFAEQTVSQNDYGTEEWDYSLSAIDTETAALQAENERLRERCEELEVNRKSMRERVIDLQAEHDWVRKKLGVPLGTRMTEGDPCVCGTLHVWESRKDMIPMYETSLKRAKADLDKLRRKTIDLEGMLATAHEAAAKAMAERDEVNQRAERAEAKLEELQRSGDKKGSTL